jgi:ribosomal protein S2
MKLKHIKIKKYKMMRLYLSKYEAYKTSKIAFGSIDTILDRLEIGLKRALFVIYQYHIFNKTILFIGLPQSMDKRFVQVLLKSKHIFVPSYAWEKGSMGNKMSISKQSRNFSYFKKFLEMKNNPQLIVLLNEGRLQNIVPECQKLCIPIVYIGSHTEEIDSNSYIVEGNFITRKMKNFFHFLIYSILKKSPVREQKTSNFVYSSRIKRVN